MMRLAQYQKPSCRSNCLFVDLPVLKEKVQTLREYLIFASGCYALYTVILDISKIRKISDLYSGISGALVIHNIARGLLIVGAITSPIGRKICSWVIRPIIISEKFSTITTIFALLVLVNEVVKLTDPSLSSPKIAVAAKPISIEKLLIANALLSRPVLHLAAQFFRV